MSESASTSPSTPTKPAAPLFVRPPVVVQNVDDQVYQALRDEIMNGLAPGTVLRLADVADRLGVSTMPVRTALVRLATEGLVVQLPRRGGAVVAPMEVERLEEIQALRAGIEGLAARLGAESATPTTLRRMREALRDIKSAARAGDATRYLAATYRLEGHLYAAAGRPRLLKLVEDHRALAERYIRAFMRERDLTVADDEELVGAAAARDGARAQAILQRNIRAFYERVAREMRQSPPDVISR
jgi:DNA-binding GntR family transcriptional regulator